MRKTALCIGIANCAADVFYLVILALKTKKKKLSHHPRRHLGELGNGRLGGKIIPIFGF